MPRPMPPRRNQPTKAAVAVAEPPETPAPTTIAVAEPEEDDSGDALADAFAGLAAAFRNSGAEKARKRAALDQGLKQVADALQENPDLAKDPAVWEALEKITGISEGMGGGEDLAPGTIRKINDFLSEKVPWQWRDVQEPPPEYRAGGAKHGQPLPKHHVEWVYNVYIPSTEPVTYNDLQTVLFGGTYYTGPKCFWDVYAEAKRLNKAAHEHAGYLFNNAGGIPPSDPGIVNFQSQAVRAMHDHKQGMPEGFLPGAGVGRLRSERAEGEGGEASEEGVA